MKDHYQTLGVEPDVSDEALKSAYRRRVMLLHPDRHQDAPQPVQQEAAKAMAEVVEAWEVLGNPANRAIYDMLRKRVDEAQRPGSRTTPSDRTEPASPHGPQSDQSEFVDLDDLYLCLHDDAEPIKLARHTGLLLMRVDREFDDDLCLRCATRLYNRWQRHTLIFGWWGLISIMVTPFVLISNEIQLSRHRRRFSAEERRSTKRPMWGLVSMASLVVIIATLIATSQPPAYEDPGSSSAGRVVSPTRGGGAGTPYTTTTSFSRPSYTAQWEVGSCVAGSSMLRPVPCGSSHTGRIVRSVSDPENCPLTAELYVEHEDHYLCLDMTSG